VPVSVCLLSQGLRRGRYFCSAKELIGSISLYEHLMSMSYALRSKTFSIFFLLVALDYPFQAVTCPEYDNTSFQHRQANLFELLQEYLVELVFEIKEKCNLLKFA
jgi:hypothetical protein